jgi:hypothetical protein
MPRKGMNLTLYRIFIAFSSFLNYLKKKPLGFTAKRKADGDRKPLCVSSPAVVIVAGRVDLRLMLSP